MRASILLGVTIATACTGAIDRADPTGASPSAPSGDAPHLPAPAAPGSAGASGSPAPAAPPFVPVAGSLRRLTTPEYQNTVADLLGGGVPVPTRLETDTPSDGFTTIGAARDPVSPVGVEQYDAAALDLTDALFADATRRMALVGCAPASLDDPCAQGFLQRFGRRAWRRPLTAAELAAKTALGKNAMAQLGGGAWVGLRFAVASLLQSPFFVYRVELGEPDPAQKGRRRYTPWEMASRLSYFLVGTTPDDALLDAAARGDLATADGVRAQAARLLASSKLRPSLMRFFAEHLQTALMSQIAKDRKLYPLATDTLGASARREVETLIGDLVFGRKADFRDFFDTRQAFVNADLARVYGVAAAPDGAAFSTALVPVTLPDDGPRAGYLGTAGFLAMEAHNTKTSPTLRGLFVRESLLCQAIPPPPGNADPTFPDPVAGQFTTRQRLEQHRADPACAGCHTLMDGIGVALENFDAVGAYRSKEGGLAIDASGELDGVRFDGGRQLGQALRANPRALECVVRKLYGFAAGHTPSDGEEAVVQALAARWQAASYRLLDLLPELVTSDGFRFAADPS